MEVHLGFWLQVFLKAEIIQNCLGSMRLEHIRRLTPSSGAIPLRLSHASNVVIARLQNLAKHQDSQDISRLFHGRCCDGAPTSNLVVSGWVLLVI